MKKIKGGIQWEKIKNIEIVTNVMLNRYGSYHGKSGARLGIVSAILVMVDMMVILL